MTYARQLFTLQQPVEGSTGLAEHNAPLAAHLRQVAQSLGKDPDEFIAQHLAREGDGEAQLEPPEELIWHWKIFLELNAARSRHSEGPNPISFQEIRAWSELHGIELEAWEVDLVRELCTEWLKAHYDRSRATRAEDPEPGSRRRHQASRPVHDVGEEG